MLLPPDSAPSQHLRAPAGRPCFFAFDGEAWTPTAPSRSPWNPGATGGVPVAGLLMHAADEVEAPGPMLAAHVTIDILRPVPFGPTRTRAAVTRPGKKMQMVESYLVSADGETVARARVMRVREIPTPMVAAPAPWPGPDEAILQPPFQPPRPMASVIETRRLVMDEAAGSKGVLWARFIGDLAPGVPIGPLGRVAMLSDFGNGLAQIADREHWTFANVDISVHLARLPAGEWILLEAESLMQGVGVGVSSMVLADLQGEFGRAHQTLFIDPAPGAAR